MARNPSSPLTWRLSSLGLGKLGAISRLARGITLAFLSYTSTSTYINNNLQGTMMTMKNIQYMNAK
jgi:hypothetical protein